MKIASVTPAWNEEEYISYMILSLREQTLFPEPIIIIDDGSTDDTAKVANELGCTVLEMPFHKESYAGKPELANVVNYGLTHLKNIGEVFNYVLIVGADHVLPPKYIEQIVTRMEENERLVVASGLIDGESFEESTPRGSGRVVDYNFWNNVNGLQYPVEWGWESWLYLKAQSMGYTTECFQDITSHVKRPTSIKKSGAWGKGMYALGYDWKYALGRCATTFLKNPMSGWSMFWNWLLHRDVKRMDIAKWVNQMQNKLFWEKFTHFLKGEKN